jgi:AI-2 transport protein TqsA
LTTKKQQNSTPPSLGIPGPARFLIIAAAFVIVVAGMRAAVEIIVPFLMSVFLAVISTPALFWLKKKSISTPLAIVFVSLVLLVGGILVGVILTTSIADFTKDLPVYGNKLEREIQKVENRWNNWFEERRISFRKDKSSQSDTTPANVDKSEETATTVETEPISSEPASEKQKHKLSLSSFVNAEGVIKIMGDLMGQLGGIVTDGFLIYLTMVFILLEASILPNKIKMVMQKNPEAFGNLAKVADDIKKYLAIKTAFSLVTGILVMSWLIILEVKYPIVWGLLAFLLNFVPAIGSIIAAVPATLLAFLQLGPSTALITALGFLVVNVVIGNLIEPRLMGQRLGLSTLVVFLSLVFWGWVLGPMGMLLSVPLTMTIKIALQSHKETRSLSLLLGS